MKTEFTHKNQFRTSISGNQEFDINELLNLESESLNQFRAVELFAKNRKGMLVKYVAKKNVVDVVDGNFATICTSTLDKDGFARERCNEYETEDDFNRAVRRMMRRYKKYSATRSEWIANYVGDY